MPCIRVVLPGEALHVNLTVLLLLLFIIIHAPVCIMFRTSTARYKLIFMLNYSNSTFETVPVVAILKQFRPATFLQLFCSGSLLEFFFQSFIN